MKINFDKPYVTVGGRLPLVYMQDGCGFNDKGEFIGKFDAQGEAVAERKPRAPKEDNKE
jgi:hypothetical protein